MTSEQGGWGGRATWGMWGELPYPPYLPEPPDYSVL